MANAIKTIAHKEGNMESSNLQIPINTRTIGNPQGNTYGSIIYTLYIEDYVHTFLQKNLETNKNATKIALFGKCIDEKLIISGAAISSGSVSKDKDTCAAYFPSSIFLATAVITKGDKNNVRFEITSGGMLIIIEDYYIYYDQNEEMQNYLISWNAGVSSPSSSRQSRAGDVAHYGKIIQAYNKEEAKVSFMWNILTMLCMGFVVCFMAYGIITINSYNKMQSMQSGIDYCMNILNQQLAEVERNIEIDTEENVVTAEIEEETEKNVIEVSNIRESELENEIKEPETQETINNDVPQYYIVQKGDTLRTICYEMYGDYEYVEKVCKWNDIEDPNTILCGQKLLLW
jgi:hypothetical protein